MTDYAKKEAKLLEKIGKEMDKLDDSLAKMEETDSKVKHFYEQEKALHEVKSIIRKENKIEKDEVKAAEEEVSGLEGWLNHEDSLVKGIVQEIAKLDTTLGGINEDDNKVKSYLEQKKAVHEIKAILKKADKLAE
ncbi:hypothetical protein [Enterococcus sp. BWR-S5]|uniref:hypothetical protein n=1 Tax=Enterococcus sp. BWR-S5 TaxID=2787714 RepID=UPI001921FF47|nr:hypothetical protein [Enterococcus sp. BWR-S5]MBL1224965.1 hypothetical protein [Enterococcus sp. BWR-S5]